MPLDPRLARGARSEALAAEFLMQRGYRILARNFRAGRGEIDLIGLHRGALCFAEVRSRSGSRFGRPGEAIGRRKRRQVIRAARGALAMRRWPRHQTPRFDVVGVDLSREPPELEMIQDAFDVLGDP